MKTPEQWIANFADTDMPRTGVSVYLTVNDVDEIQRDAREGMESERDTYRTNYHAMLSERDALRAKLDASERTAAELKAKVDAAWRKGMTDAAELCGEDWYSAISSEKILAACAAKSELVTKPAK